MNNSDKPVLAPKTRIGRASLSQSPLARPERHIHMLAGRVQDYLYLPYPDPLYIVLGTVAANMIKGVPVWLGLIGPPSTGKTVILETLADMGPKSKLDKGKPAVHIIGAPKTPAALLSGTARGELAKDATGGLLKWTGPRGIIVIKDFTSVLSLPKDHLTEMIGSLRDVFDGRYSRPIGAEGGRVLEWRGRLGLLMATTPTIDRFSSHIGDLGERWIYYRYHQTDGYGETMKALSVRDPENMMEDLRILVQSFFEDIEMRWDEPRREFSDMEKSRFYAMAALAVGSRSGVPRDPYKGNEIVDITHKETTPRIAGELGQLYLGLERIGLEERECWRLVGKVALDSVRQLRMSVLLALHGARVMRISDVKALLKCGNKAMDDLIEDLEVLGMVEEAERRQDRMGGRSSFGSIKLTRWAEEQLDMGFWKHMRESEEEWDE